MPAYQKDESTAISEKRPPKPELALCALLPIRALSYGRRAFVARVSFKSVSQLNSAQGVWTYVLARRAAGLADRGRATSQGRAARRAITTSAQYYRQLAGLTTVKLDRQLSAGCMEHANYMVQNEGTSNAASHTPILLQRVKRTKTEF